jgi:hypothetical protein
MEESPSSAIIRWSAFKSRRSNTKEAKKPNARNLNPVTSVDKQTNKCRKFALKLQKGKLNSKAEFTIVN